MRILISVASRHGATDEIGQRIAAVLGRAGHDVDRRQAGEVDDVAGYEAVIIGSGVYVGRWLQAARDLIERNQAALRERSVWLFSSGPIGDPLKPEVEPQDVAEMVEISAARGHRLLPGRLERSRLGLGERAVVALVRAAEGDYRSWPEIDAWAEEIAESLHEATRQPAPASRG